MMHKFKKSIKKDCLLQNRFIYEFEKKIDRSFVKFLKKFGKVCVFEEFAIPLITMDVPYKFRLQALMNSDKIDVFFKNLDFVDEFEKKLDDYVEGESKK